MEGDDTNSLSVEECDELTRSALVDQSGDNGSASTHSTPTPGVAAGPSGLHSALAGVVAGAGTNFIFYPMDVVKARYQVTPILKVGMKENIPSGLPVYRNFFTAVTTMWRTEGFLSLYQGVGPSLVGNAVAWGSYFYIYNMAKSRIESAFLDSKHSDHHTISRAQSAPINLGAGFIAGIVTACVTNPIWVVKLRMQVQTRGTPALSGNYRGLFHGFRMLYKEEGARGYFRGLVPGLLGTAHGAVQFMTYEEIIYRMKQLQEDSTAPLPSPYFMVAGSLSKAVAAGITYPYQVIRSRLQLRPREGEEAYTGVRDVLSRVWQREGIRGFYRGIFVNICRVMPSGGVTFFIYESIMKSGILGELLPTR